MSQTAPDIQDYIAIASGFLLCKWRAPGVTSFYVRFWGSCNSLHLHTLLNGFSTQNTSKHFTPFPVS